MRRAAAVAGVAAGAALMLLSAGCGVFQRRAPVPPAVIIPQPPILFVSQPPQEPPMAPPQVWARTTGATLPDFLAARLELAALPAPPKPAPRRAPGTGEHGAGEHAAAAPPDTAAPEAPQLTPSLSPEQQQAYRNNTLAVLDQTDQDLKTLYQRRDLDTAAAATRAQATEYVRQAREALGQGDLVRAQTLASKAETLARFLLGK